MNKKVIRLTESDLHRIVNESTNRILKESVSRNERISKIHLTSIRPGRLGNPRFLVQGISEFGNSFEGKTSENANFVYNCERFEGKTCQVLYHTSRNGDYIVDNMRPVQGLPESDLHRIVKESVEKIIRESEPDLYDALARPDGKLDMSNPYTWATSPKMMKDMGYDENGMKRGKKYYDHLLNPNWRFNKQRSAGTEFALDEPMGDQKYIRADIANMEKRQNDADARWKNAADSRPLHRKGSLNREF